MPLADYDTFEFDDGGISHTVYKRGTGPAVLLLHELPGLSHPTFDLADGFIEQGFTLYVPLLFGKAGDFKVASNVPKLCVNREMRVFEHRCRIEQEPRDPFPIISVERFDIRRERAVVERHHRSASGVIDLRAASADDPVAEGRALGADRDDADVLGQTGTPFVRSDPCTLRGVILAHPAPRSPRPARL